MTVITTDEIEALRITYEKVGPGVRMDGSAFTIDFDAAPIDPEAFADTVLTPREPWYTFGVRTALSDEGYWKLALVLFHVDDAGETTGASKLTLEYTDEWARVYVKEGADAERVKEFLETLADHYDLTFNLPERDRDE